MVRPRDLKAFQVNGFSRLTWMLADARLRNAALIGVAAGLVVAEFLPTSSMRSSVTTVPGNLESPPITKIAA